MTWRREECSALSSSPIRFATLCANASPFGSSRSGARKTGPALGTAICNRGGIAWFTAPPPRQERGDSRHRASKTVRAQASGLAARAARSTSDIGDGAVEGRRGVAGSADAAVGTPAAPRYSARAAARFASPLPPSSSPPPPVTDPPPSSSLPWHFLYFLPEPHGHGSLRPTLGRSRLTGAVVGPSPATCAPRRRARLRCLLLLRRRRRPLVLVLVGDAALDRLALLRLERRDGLLLALDLDAEQLGDDVLLDAVHHLGEQREAGLLVFLLRILLAVALEADAFTERVHRLEVLDPLLSISSR